MPNVRIDPSVDPPEYKYTGGIFPFALSILGYTCLGAGVAALVNLGFFAGMSQRLDELDGPMHDCPPCPLEHVEAATPRRCETSLILPGAITPPFRRGGGTQAIGVTQRLGRVR